MKKLRVGVIGTGNMGKNHCRVYSEIANLVAVADISKESVVEVAKKYKCRSYTDYREMLANESLDAVSVVVPTDLHSAVVLSCLDKQIPTLVEKPIASTILEAEEMQKKAAGKETFLMVGHIERFNPAVVQLKKLIELGRLGKIISLLSIRVGISPPKNPNSDVALDLGIHDVDIFNYLLSAFPTSKKIIKTKLFGKNVSDSSILLLEYGKVSGVIQTNWITPVKMRKLFVSGVGGYAELDLILQKLVLHDKILQTRFDGSFYEFVSIAEKAEKKQIRISKKEPLREELLFFLSHRTNWKASNIIDAIEALRIVS